MVLNSIAHKLPNTSYIQSPSIIEKGAFFAHEIEQSVKTVCSMLQNIGKAYLQIEKS